MRPEDPPANKAEDKGTNGGTAMARVSDAAMESLPTPHRNRQARDRLEQYLDALLRHNVLVNLVSRKDTTKHVERFVLESAFLASLLIDDWKRLGVDPPRLVDLGSGGGFPGLALKILLPAAEVTLVEATQKKARFLAETCQALELRGITVIAARAEVLADRKSSFFRPEFRHRFDWVTTKALGTISETLRLAAPFLRVDGVHWTFKGRGVREETRAAGRLLKQLRFKPFRVDRMAGSPASYVVSFRRLEPAPPKAR